MATAQAQVVAEATGSPVTFGYWDDQVFPNNPFIAMSGQAVPINDRPGSRPYILGQVEGRMIWNPRHRASPGYIYLEEHELPKLEGDYVVIEPNVKGTVSGPNKDWGFDRYQVVANHLLERGVRLAQLRGPFLDGVERFETETFREACSVIAGSQGYLGNEGGLHHAAAAFGKKAVVVFGGFIHPDVTGYSFHVNLGGDWCGQLSECPHCSMKLDEITTEQVIEAAESLHWVRPKADHKLSGSRVQRGFSFNGSGQRYATDPGTATD